MYIHDISSLRVNLFCIILLRGVISVPERVISVPERAIGVPERVSSPGDLHHTRSLHLPGVY